MDTMDADPGSQVVSWIQWIQIQAARTPLTKLSVRSAVIYSTLTENMVAFSWQWESTVDPMDPDPWSQVVL